MDNVGEVCEFMKVPLHYDIPIYNTMLDNLDSKFVHTKNECRLTMATPLVARIWQHRV